MRPIYEIAKEIRNDWKKMSPYAKPYVDAMMYLNTVDSKYACDDAKEIITYFLCNASTWRGEVARRIKKELKDGIN
jgi:hypothetical protein